MRTPSSRKPSSRSARPLETDAIELLKADHNDIRTMFENYDDRAHEGASASDKQTLASLICTMLTVHATIEEELLYPAIRKALPDAASFIDEAKVEHACAKDLIAQVQSSSPGQALYDAKLKVLGEWVAHHIAEEERELFPRLMKSSLDLRALGDALAARMETLLEA